MSDKLVPLPLTRPEKTSFTDIGSAMAENWLDPAFRDAYVKNQMDLESAAEERGYERAVAVLREEAAKTISACETAAAEFTALAPINRTAGWCARVVASAGEHVTALVERVADRA